MMNEVEFVKGKREKGKGKREKGKGKREKGTGNRELNHWRVAAKERFYEDQVGRTA